MYIYVYAPLRIQKHPLYSTIMHTFCCAQDLANQCSESCAKEPLVVGFFWQEQAVCAKGV